MKDLELNIGNRVRKKIIFYVLLVLLTTVLPGCGVYDLAKCISAQEKPKPFDDVAKFDRLETFPPPEDTSIVQHDYVVFESTVNGSKAPPLLLLHELPGLTKKTLHFANWLSTQGFTVYVPLLFGEMGETSNAGGFINYFTSQEWIPFVDTKINYHYIDERVERFVGETRPINQWLRKFIKEEIEGSHPKQAIGVIGMCLTGATPLALLDNPKIQRVVVAQPTLPFMFWGTENDKKSLGLSELELNNAIKRVKTQGVRILSTRYLNDCIAKREKHVYMQNIFGEMFVDGEIFDYVYSLGKKPVQYRAHSTLIGEWPREQNPYHPSQQLREKVVSFLKENKSSP